MKTIVRLVLVYDANSGKLGAFVDSAKKLLMIKGCALCTITHGISGERGEWKTCKNDLGVPVDYYHRDDAPEQVGVAAKELPCVLANTDDGGFEVLVSARSLNDCTGVADLRGRIEINAVSKGLRLQPASDV